MFNLVKAFAKRAQAFNVCASQTLLFMKLLFPSNFHPNFLEYLNRKC